MIEDEPTNPVLDAINELIRKIESGEELPSLTLDVDTLNTLPELDQDDIDDMNYAASHWDD